MKFSIVTPSYRNSAWLKLGVASVADQHGVQVEHIVQDSCSDDGTQDWLPHDPRVRAFIEKDTGMYDAINRGFQRATGDVLAYLNCDEQYLPGALAAVGEVFSSRPEIDVVVADSIVVDGEGEYLCHRCSLVPTVASLWVRFPVLTSSLFFRRSVVHDQGIKFDPQWRAVGDAFFVGDLLQHGCRFALLPRFTSIFTDTGENLCSKPESLRERERRAAMVPRGIRLIRPLLLARHRLKMATRGAYTMAPFDFELYTHSNPKSRITRHVAKPTVVWPGHS